MLDGTATNRRTGATAGLRDVIISTGMHDDQSSDNVGVIATADSPVVSGKRQRALAIFTNSYVANVASVKGVVNAAEAMWFISRIPMPANVVARSGMQVNPVLARRQVFQMQYQSHSIVGLCKVSSSGYVVSVQAGYESGCLLSVTSAKYVVVLTGCKRC